MKLLLDSHAFIWWDNDLGKMSPAAVALYQDPTNTLLLSVASVWEMQIKTQTGKLKLPLALLETISNQQRTNRLQIVPVTLEHVLALETLPLHHKDPFDRILIAQARVEDAVLISHDRSIAQYPVRVLW
jgi:PIN domain nuclease of toxin-antitoxin system